MTTEIWLAIVSLLVGIVGAMVEGNRRSLMDKLSELRKDVRDLSSKVVTKDECVARYNGIRQLVSVKKD